MGWFARKKKQKRQDDVIRIRLSGDENLDIENSFKQMGITSKQEQNDILKNYTWHYLDDLDENLECTMQLVQTEALEATKPFWDSRDIMEKVTEIKYIRRKNNADIATNSSTSLKEIDMTEIRALSMSVCKSAGFKPASSLPTIKEIDLRPASEIAGRLHSIKGISIMASCPF